MEISEKLQIKAQTELDKLQTEISAAQSVVTDKASTCKKLKDRIDAATVQLLTTQSDKRELELQVSALNDTKLQLAHDIATVEQQLKVAQTKVILADKAYQAQVDEKQAAIAKLDASLLDRTQFIEALRQEESVLRSSMAAWQKTLEEKDKNLRIREQKVELGENKLIQNSNLLNL